MPEHTSTDETALPGLAEGAPHGWDFEAIGTHWRIDSSEPLGETIRSAVHERIADFDLTYSRFRDDSIVSGLRERPGLHEFPADAAPLFALYDVLHAATDGRVTPFVGAALETLGYDAAYSFRDLSASVPAAPVPSWPAARADAGATAVRTATPVVLDLGAAGKGYLVDLVAGVLDDHGVQRHVVDASGDLRATRVALRVALEHPYDTTKAIGIARPGERALCSSATNRRAWGEGLHHVLDGVTGRPIDTVVATWAVAPTALAADGLATALFLSEPGALTESLERLAPGGAAGFDWARMFTNGRVQYSRTFPGELFV